ncbi:MAG: LysR family transcriptional regulator [Tardiphaga sp.]|jgi:DNA-binding transcriptional LysR family regulator|nr:LysR family transcriptional regulator [Tardiphaga sp.]
MRHLKLLTHVVEIARMGSIRKAAEHLNLTPSAMNRRIQDLETEVGTPLFERRPRGVKLTTAGEMFVRYARSQIADAERMKSQVEDLRGLRRGPIQIACSQALALDFLAAQIGAFQQQHPKVVFDLKVMDHDRALTALAAYEVDLALVYRPAMWPSLRVMATLPQRLAVVMRADHPLAAKKTVRLSECADFPAALPDRTLSGRQILDEVTARRELRLNMQAESNSFEMLRGLVFRCNMISFQIEIGAPSGDLGIGVVGRPVDTRDVPTADLVLCQLRGRGLSVAAATFAETLAKSMQAMKPVG